MIKAAFPRSSFRVNWKFPTLLCLAFALQIPQGDGDREAHYQLAGLVDDAFFRVPTEVGTNLLFAAVSLDRKGAPLYVKMKVVPDVKGKTLINCF
jgi:hypothetical protein